MTYKFINAGVRCVEENFWELNPQLKYISPFKEVHQADKSKNKETSSKDMWCVWMLHNPDFDNKIFQLPDDRKMEAVSNYHSSFDPTAPLIAKVIDEYDVCLSAAARAFVMEVNTMKQRAAIFAEQTYTFDTWKYPDPKKNETWKPFLIKGNAVELDKIRAQTPKIMESYYLIEQKFAREQEASRVQGGRMESLKERAMLNTSIKEDYEDDLDD